MLTAAQAQLLDGLLARYERAVSDAFLAAAADLANAADFQRLVTALGQNDLLAAMDALHLDAAAFEALTRQIEAAYHDSGRAAADAVSPVVTPDGARVVVRFDGRNLRAETWLKTRSATLVTNLIGDQQLAIRNALLAGQQAGQNPTQTALELVGRVARGSNRRVGGLIGLSSPQEGYLRSARAELASPDPEGLRNYLTRGLRDRRFDRSIAKALREGTGLPGDIADKAGDAYATRLLKLRADTIGRTETLTSLNAAQYESAQQLVEKGLFQVSEVTRVWRATPDGRTRDTHVALSGHEAALGQPFRSPSGALMLFPGDTSLGAPASETVNCRCFASTKLK
jgi:hypothetical protein